MKYLCSSICRALQTSALPRIVSSFKRFGQTRPRTYSCDIMRFGVCSILAAVFCHLSLLTSADEGLTVKDVKIQRASPFRSRNYMLLAYRPRISQEDDGMNIVRHSLLLEGTAERDRRSEAKCHSPSAIPSSSQALHTLHTCLP